MGIPFHLECLKSNPEVRWWWWLWIMIGHWRPASERTLEQPPLSILKFPKQFAFCHSSITTTTLWGFEFSRVVFPKFHQIFLGHQWYDLKADLLGGFLTKDHKELWFMPLKPCLRQPQMIQVALRVQAIFI